MARKSKTAAEMDKLRGDIQQKLCEGKTLEDIFRIFPFFVAPEQVVAAFLFQDHPYGELMAETSAHTVFRAMAAADLSESEILRSALAAGHPFVRVYNFFVKGLGRSAREVAVMCFAIEMPLVDVIKGFLSVGLTGKPLLEVLWDEKGIKLTPALIEGLLGAGYDVNGIVMLFWSEFAEDRGTYIHWPIGSHLYSQLRERGFAEGEVAKVFLSNGVPIRNIMTFIREQGRADYVKTSYVIFHDCGMSLSDVLVEAVGKYDHRGNLPNFISIQKELFGHTLDEFMEALKARGPVQGPEIRALQKAGFENDEIITLL